MIAPCHFGLEAVLKKEITELGYEILQVEDGRVLFAGDDEAVCRANLFLRTAERILIRIGSFPAVTFEELFQGTKALPWEEYIPKDGKFWVAKAASVKSKLFSPSDIQSIMKKAMVRRLGERYHVEWFPEDGASYPVRVFLKKDVVTVGIDTSGVSLHKRGYREVSGKAPITETLAAALVLLSRYKGREPFCDPFCGSGTIPIEAALIAKNRAPGLDRSFDAQKWKWLDSGLWLDAAGEAMDGEFDGSYDIWGGDIDPDAVELARHNAELAGVSDCVRFETADAGKFRRTSEFGQLVTNPPYGERLLEKEGAEALYRTFGEVYHRIPPKWRVLVITSHPEFERFFGRKADKTRKVYNGMLKCGLYQFSR